MISVDVDGIADVNLMLSNLSEIDTLAVDFRRLALKAKENITRRTGEGRDARGLAFTPYSASYLEYKEARAGRTVSNVDLYDSGNMADSILVEGNNTGSRVFFADALNEKKARKHNQGIGVPSRVFFALNESDADEIIQLAARDIDNFLSGL